MIYFLTGTVRDIVDTRTAVLVTAGGIGYGVELAGGLLATAHVGQPLECWVYHVIREQSQTLCGFTTWEERATYARLLSVSGIGPKVAMRIMDCPLPQLTAAIDQGDTDYLKQIPGLGKKTAQKLVLELRGKLTLEPLAVSPINLPSSNLAKTEAAEALVSLGYETGSVARYLEAADEALGAEELITGYLRSGA